MSSKILVIVFEMFAFTILRFHMFVNVDVCRIDFGKNVSESREIVRIMILPKVAVNGPFFD